MRKFISALILAIALVASVSSVSWGDEPAPVLDGGTWEMLDGLGGTWE